MIETAYEKHGDVAVVTVADRPANTFTIKLSGGLEGAVRRAASEEARARGAGKYCHSPWPAALAHGPPWPPELVATPADGAW
jgi:hypothetical protein